MGLDVSIRLSEIIKCPDCGKEVCLKPIVDSFSGGRDWYKILEEIGYGDEQYGNYVRIDRELVKTMAKEVSHLKPYDYEEIMKMIGIYMVNDDMAIEFEADW